MATQTVRVRVDDASIDSSVTISQILLHRVTPSPFSRMDPPESTGGSGNSQQQQEDEPFLEEAANDDDENAPSEQRHQRFQSPSAIFGQEIAYSKRSVSSELTQHRFWLPAELKIPIRVMHEANVYVGNILHTTPSTIFIEEDMQGCSLLPLYIADLPRYTEMECRVLFRQMCEAVQILHNFNCLHRNIHLNNVVVDRRGHVLLRGFHHAIMMKEYRNDNYYTTIPLSENRRKYDWYAFRAPELDSEEQQHGIDVSGEHDTGVDVWSLGVCLYIMLTGLPPFRGQGRELRRQKRQGKLADYDMVVPSLPAQDLLRRMMAARSKKRISLQQVMQHEWLRTNQEDSTAGSDSLFSSNSFQHDHGFNRDLSLSQVFLQDWGNRGEEHGHKTSKKRQSHEHPTTPDQPNHPQRPASPSGILLS